ncbi:MAG TPA: SDR family NAD(P)-dependent oxidoreductase [Spirochaetia bacterium]|nr:SDR family NAD(P)-dependent oxidoreductase [Spirochaetia bacterium]
MKTSFAGTYGPWAVIAGGSRGVGAEYARTLAGLGLNLVLIARNGKRLDTTAKEIEDRYGVAVRTLATDLSRETAAATVTDATHDLEIGLVVYNAGLSNPGSFLEQPEESHLAQLGVNCRTPLSLIHSFGARMKARHRGGIILMSSLTAFVGSPMVAGYGATKSFNLVLGEGLAFELNREGIDLLVCCAGVITPDIETNLPGARARAPLFAPPTTSPQRVVRSALRGLGHRSVVVPGVLNRLVSIALQRVLPRSVSVWLMARTVARLDFPGS